MSEDKTYCDYCGKEMESFRDVALFSELFGKEYHDKMEAEAAETGTDGNMCDSCYGAMIAHRHIGR